MGLSDAKIESLSTSQVEVYLGVKAALEEKETADQAASQRANKAKM